MEHSLSGPAGRRVTRGSTALARSILGPAVLTAVVMTCAPAAFAATFTATTAPLSIGNGCSGHLGGGASSAPLSAAVACAGPGYAKEASAYATYGLVGAMGYGAGNGGGFGDAYFTDTVRFTSSDPLATQTTVAVQLALDGLLAASAGPPNPNQTNAVAQAEVSAALYFNETAPLMFNRSLVDDPRGFASSTFRNDFSVVSGDPLAANLNVLLRSFTFIVPLNRDISYTFRVNAGTYAYGDNAVAQAEFSHTFGFPTGINAFVLPTGVTANAGDYLVNNRFGSDTPGVPEPATWAMLVAGFGLAGAALRGARAGHPRDLASS